MSKKFNVAVVGATGAVGEVMLSILAERKFPVDKVYALASERSAGKMVEFGRQVMAKPFVPLSKDRLNSAGKNWW